MMYFYRPYSIMEIMKEGKRMGLMDREYMNRTPEEREAERLVEKQHRDRVTCSHHLNL